MLKTPHSFDEGAVCEVYNGEREIGTVCYGMNYSQNWREYELLIEDDNCTRIGFQVQLTDKECDALFTETPDFSKLEKAMNEIFNRTFLTLQTPH